MYELSGRRCAYLTRALRWIGVEICEIPTFDGLSEIQEFLQKYEVKVPLDQRLKALDVALRATPTRWWATHKRNIANWETCHRLLIVRFGEDDGGMNYKYDGHDDLEFMSRLVLKHGNKEVL